MIAYGNCYLKLERRPKNKRNLVFNLVFRSKAASDDNIGEYIGYQCWANAVQLISTYRPIFSECAPMLGKMDSEEDVIQHWPCRLASSLRKISSDRHARSRLTLISRVSCYGSFGIVSVESLSYITMYVIKIFSVSRISSLQRLLSLRYYNYVIM